MVQALLPQDTEQRLQYAIRFQQLARDNNNFLNNLIMSDEAHFHLNRSIIYDAGLAVTILILFRSSLGSPALDHVPPNLKPVPLAHICVRFHLDTKPNDLSPVLMLHGLTGSKETWRGVYEVIATETKRKVCILDARDHGDSPWTDNFSVDAMAMDLDYFMQQNKISKAILVGHSMGGIVAMKLALNKPETVEKVVVEDISPRPIEVDEKEAVVRYKALKDILTNIPAGTDLQTAKRIVLDYLEPKQPGDDEERRDKDADGIPLKIENGVFKWKTNFDGLLDAYKKKEHLGTDLSGIYNGNGLFIYGTKSIFKVYDDKDLILKFFPKAQFVGIETASHVLHKDFPQYMTEVLRFINRH